MAAINDLIEACVRGGLSERAARSLIEQVRNEPVGTQLVLVETDDTDPFIEFRRVYPKRYGTCSWSDAEKAFRTALRKGVKHFDIIEGARGYKEMCDRDNKTGTQYVMQPARFVRSGEYNNQLSMRGVINVHTDEKRDAANRRAAHATAAMAGGFLRTVAKQQ